MKTRNTEFDQEGTAVNPEILRALRKGQTVRVTVRGGEQDTVGRGFEFRQRFEQQTIEGQVMRVERVRGRLTIAGCGSIAFENILNLS